jgi:formylglycine-generating enzyme required for sulfatase activity
MKIKNIFPLAATAALITSAAASVTIDYVSVGHAGNAAGSNGYGAVAYAYYIGKYEVTNAQYGAFLNAVDPSGANANGVYNSYMGTNARGGITYTPGAASGQKYTIRANMGNKPVNYVSWYDSARFTNWMNNGQGTGSTEIGAYTLNGNTGLITRNVGATVYLPNWNEWDKAAYYDPTPGAGGGDNYWLYPTQSDTAPTVGSANFSTGDISNPGANVANYNYGADWNDLDGNVTTVGSAAANNYFGTFDQGGNVFEWNDTVVGGAFMGLLSGCWDQSGSYNMSSSFRGWSFPYNDSSNAGFRVASLVPEPTSLLLTMLAGGVMLARRKR